MTTATESLPVLNGRSPLDTPVSGLGIVSGSTLGRVLGDELALLVFLRHLG